MYFLPGLDYTAHWTDFARKRWGITVREYPHWNLSYFLRVGVFRLSPDPRCEKLSITDIEAKAREDSGLEWIGYGYKKIDSLQRRGFLSKSWPDGINPERKCFTPIAEWNNTVVKQYLARRRIPIPGIDGKRSGGIDLSPACLAWLRAEWPDDLRRILKVFPLAARQADRAPQIEANEKTERAARKLTRRAGAGTGDHAFSDQTGGLQPACDL